MPSELLIVNELMESVSTTWYALSGISENRKEFRLRENKLDYEKQQRLVSHVSSVKDDIFPSHPERLGTIVNQSHHAL